MRALLIVVILVLTGTAALAQGWWLHFRLAYLLAAALALSYVWSWANVYWLTVSRRTNTQRTQVGNVLVADFTIGNVSPIPKLWVEIHDRSTMPGYHVGVVKALGGRQSLVWTSRVECHARGVFRLGPIIVRSGDPFGLFTHERTIPETSAIVVYPRTVPVPGFPLPTGKLPRDQRSDAPTRDTTPHATGVREHQPGESLNRIHWPTTARTGRLMAREFAMDPSSDVWIVLDAQAGVHAGFGSESTEEYAVTVAASLAKHYLDANLAVGLVTSGSESRIVDVNRGPNQLIRILEWLAVLRTDGMQSLAELLAREERRFSARGARTGLVIVTPATDEAWVAGIGRLVRRGISVTAVLIEASTFGAGESPLGLVGTLAAASIPTYLIKRGEPLERALVAPRLP